MEIRKFHASDISQIVQLFYETVHTVNKKDYTQDQLDVWAPKDEMELKRELWMDTLSSNITLVAQINEEIVGFIDMTHNGYLDRLYVHKDFQAVGIGSSLIIALESKARRRGITEISTDASITAKAFFHHHGYQIVQTQSVVRKGILLVNFKMIKKIIQS